MSSTRRQSLRHIFDGPVIREDTQLLWMLIGLAAADIGIAAYLSLFPVNAGFLYFVVVVLFGAIAFIAAAGMRFKNHYSPPGIFWFLTTIAAFQALNIVVMWAGLLISWKVTGHPGYPVAIGALFGLAPLPVGVWQLGRKLRRL
jgi:hypothetical protein